MRSSNGYPGVPAFGVPKEKPKSEGDVCPRATKPFSAKAHGLNSKPDSGTLEDRRAGRKSWLSILSFVGKL